MVQTLHTSANILHVCIHKNVLTMLQWKLPMLVNSVSAIWKIFMFTNAANTFWSWVMNGLADVDGFKICTPPLIVNFTRRPLVNRCRRIPKWTSLNKSAGNKFEQVQGSQRGGGTSCPITRGSTPMWTDRMTNKTESITFPQTTYADNT